LDEEEAKSLTSLQASKQPEWKELARLERQIVPDEVAESCNREERKF
jgi:hypothetical protein